MRVVHTITTDICLLLMVCVIAAGPVNAGGEGEMMEFSGIDIQQVQERLKDHLRALTITIGERSVRYPVRLAAAAEYLTAFYENLGIPVHTEPYRYRDMDVANVVAEVSPGPEPSARYIVGAHYDSVAGTVGADDNASAVAVQLETARLLQEIISREKIDVGVKFISFALEEPPVYGTEAMGSRVYAKNARRRSERIDGMICLEMVGYTCSEPGCQRYPFPLGFFGYPEDGTFVGILGNTRSRAFTRELASAFQKNPDLPVVKLTVPFNGWILPAVRLSDHASFWSNGYRAVMVTDSAFFRNPHYHLPSDTMDKLDYRFMAELVKSVARFFMSPR